MPQASAARSGPPTAYAEPCGLVTHEWLIHLSRCDPYANQMSLDIYRVAPTSLVAVYCGFSPTGTRDSPFVASFRSLAGRKGLRIAGSHDPGEKCSQAI
jgi:hypothetical protein